MKIPMSSWGRLSALPHEVMTLNAPHKVAHILRACGKSSPGLAFGMGRSYGDVCLNPQGVLWKASALDHFVSFDPARGILVCEAGVLLRDIQRTFVPMGWMLAVTPGTQIVTVGGAIANDVHGKNHHVQGSFGDHIQEITLVRTDGQTIVCGPDACTDWFHATVGGMGLTGVITHAKIQLRKVAGPWLETEIVPYHDFDEFFALAEHSEAKWEHTVSWIDCLSGNAKGLFMRANHLSDACCDLPIPRKREKRLPFTPPISMVNRLSLKPFNTTYFALNARKAKAGRSVVHYEQYSYPLDALLEWNRIYGPRGFYQYQSVVPPEAGKDAVLAMLQETSRSGQGSFLAVLKTFGQRRSVGMLGFPMPGVTLSMDFPNRGDSTLALLNRLDAIVKEARGRIYTAKDARMPRILFEASTPRLQEFLKYRDPGISSGLSKRLMGY